PAQHGGTGAGAQYGLLLAVPVERQPAGRLGEVLLGLEAPAGPLLGEEVLDHPHVACQRASVLTWQQVGVVVGEGGHARRLEPYDRHTAVDVALEPRDVGAGHALSLAQEALGDLRPATAAVVHELDVVAEPFEDLDRRASRPWLVELGPRVHEQGHRPALGRSCACAAAL